jgi:4-amino-4-deoxy-L-arabinose transferase-like glycosyltransferase
MFSGLTLVFFSISGSKLATYILPMFPPLAAFTAVAVADRPRFLARSTRVAAGLALFVAAGLLVYSQRRNGLIPAQAAGWGSAAAVAALMAVAVSWRAGSAGARPPWDSEPQAGGWSPMAVALLFIFVWQALLCEYTVIPPSRSAYALAQAVAHYVHPGTALYSVGEYRQTIPPYLGRTLTLVSFEGSGELDFGEAEEPGRQSATPEEFLRRWQASRDAIAFFDPRVWDHYQRQGFPGRVIAQDSFTIAVSRS